jgi:hypothetical protein
LLDFNGTANGGNVKGLLELLEQRMAWTMDHLTRMASPRHVRRLTGLGWCSQ